MQTKMGAGPLLDARGRLAETGWATAEVRRYDRARIAAGKLRIKEWDYYCILTDAFGIALTVADNGYLGFLGVSWMDLAAGTAINDGAVIPWPMGRMRLAESADAGDIEQRRGGMLLRFRHEPGGRRLTVEAPNFGGGQGLAGELWLAQPPMDRMVIATPFSGAPRAFYYNQKINCLAAEGEIRVGNTLHRFSPDRAFGVLDWGRGVWTYDNVWYWGSASGMAGERRIGFNIGYGFGDTAAASENMVFVDGTAHKLDRIAFHMPAGGPDAGPWRFTSNDGRFEMTMDPIVNRHHSTNLGLFRTVQDQVFGRFSGRIILDDGSALDIAGLTGFAEEVRNRW